ncbi:unnamed protein product [Adineta steineri]|uniref:Zinc-binding loop region of homing endonuclease domain-containing protein n=1 Tax=Adineta steineri TaxID=433720 RepID=A0A815Y146_9BILA|nr:unnamed protein product [Adineta steineri]CAF1511057.1 unnamed protein product [Adineta steineri]CAF1564546.1 unnamed protein product [Adineta steineri]CAF1666194.1 unnamed protein product [Adineta steineri]
MASTNNPQEFLNSLELGEVSDFVSDLFTLYSYLDLVNDDHFKSLSIKMEQLVTMKNARGEQYPDGRSGHQLPLLAGGRNHEQASHLCDTTGCLREEHLCIEKQEVNQSRCRCDGIVLHIGRNIADEFCIFQVTPCKHMPLIYVNK